MRAALETRLLPFLDGRATPATPTGRAALALLGGVGRLYGALGGLSRRAYREGWRESWRAPCPVISVGNVVSGGTGKTPVVTWLAGRLQAAGRRVAVVSRGYRQPGGGRELTVVADWEGVRQEGGVGFADEALLVARALPGVVVLTSPRRRVGITHAVEALGCDTVVLDDAFQHRQVARDLDIVLLDGVRPFGNGRILPGGVLREPVAALGEAGLILFTRCSPGVPREESLERVAGLVDPGVPLLRCDHLPGGWSPLGGGARGGAPEGGPVWGFCGIAQPDSFRETLTRHGVSVAGFTPFPDHHSYTPADLATLGGRARAAGAGALVCTAKDGVKIPPDWSPLPLWALGVTVVFREGGEERAWKAVQGVLR